MNSRALKLKEILNSLLLKRNISKKSLAKGAGVGQSSFNKITTGETANPQIESVSKIASYLGLTVSELIGETPIIENKDPMDSIAAIDLECFIAACNAVEETCRINNCDKNQKIILIRDVYIRLTKSNPSNLEETARILADTLKDLI